MVSKKVHDVQNYMPMDSKNVNEVQKNTSTKLRKYVHVFRKIIIGF
jgi:hypothetical protein